MKTQLHQLIRIRFIQHLVFWCLSLLVLVNLMRVSADLKTIDWVYGVVFQFIIVLPVYINLLLLVPRIMARNRYFLYFLTVVLDLAIGIGFYFLVFNYVVDWILPGYYFVAVYDVFEIGLILLAYLLLTLLLKLARAWFFVNKSEQERTRYQLEALKSQINPHFLFNTLSSIYSLSRKKSDMTPGVILQLSDIMRYMIYETNSDTVKLIKELEIINNIIEIHQVRFGEAFVVEKNIEGDIGEIKIAPLLFIPFVENAMKYCSPSTDGNFFFGIHFTINENTLCFKIENSYAKNDDKGVEQGGIGLENVSKRLSLLYPDKYRLYISENHHVFKVELFLTIR